MRTFLEIVPPQDMRYPSVADWRWDLAEKALLITIVDLVPEVYREALFQHEQYEARLCLLLGISQEEVDAYDRAYEAARDTYTAPCGCSTTRTSEPGDDIHCPYYGPHQDATVVEHLTISRLRENWTEYEDTLAYAYRRVRMAKEEEQ